MSRDLRLWFALPLLLLLCAAQAVAADPPARVGRLSLLDGDVSIRQEGSPQRESASLNWPLTSGDEIETGRGGRAEIRIGSSALRLGSRTAVRILRLDDERIRVRLEGGSVAVRVRSPEPAAAIEIETRDGDVVPIGPAHFRVDYDDPTVSLTSYSGDLNFRSDDSDVIVSEGRQAHVRVTDRTDVRWDAPEDDDFAAWVLARDERDDALGAAREVSPEMTGVEDLYEYGDWRASDEYGAVWYPRGVAPGWAPYRSGRWISVDPWGWTWVDDAPWGFAPFHYGRWVLIGGTWAWVPGRYVARPVYAPALVVWLGLPGVSIALSSGSVPHVGWFPLGPREVYVPSYRYSSTYVREINITHVTNVVEITRIVRDPRHAHHAYRDRREAVTLVRGDVVRDSRPVFQDARRLDERVWKLPRAATPIPPLEARRVAERDRVERSRRADDRPQQSAPLRAREDAGGRRASEPEATRAAPERRFSDAEGERRREGVDSSAIRREEHDRLRGGPNDEPRAVERRERETPRVDTPRERVREAAPQSDDQRTLQLPSQQKPQQRPDAERRDFPRAREQDDRRMIQSPSQQKPQQRPVAEPRDFPRAREQDDRRTLQSPSQQKPQQRPDAERRDFPRTEEQDRRDREQQSVRERQAQQSEARRQEEALRAQRQQQLDQQQRNSQEQQRRADQLRQQENERQARAQRQVEQQRQREAQERQRLGEQQRQHERERLEQRRQATEQQLQRQQQLRQEREQRAPAVERSGRREVETQRDRPRRDSAPEAQRGRDEDGRRGN